MGISWQSSSYDSMLLLLRQVGLREGVQSMFGELRSHKPETHAHTHTHNKPRNETTTITKKTVLSKGGMFRENSIETCILSRVKQITSPGWMHETSARAWCTGKTQRNRVEREVGGGSGWVIHVNPWLIHVNV